MKRILILISITSILFSCKKEVKDPNQKLKVVTTTSMITDLVKNIGGDAIEVQGLMGSGVDPHLYKASEGDVTLIGSDYFASNYDPHIWFDVTNWKIITAFVIKKLSIQEPKNADIFKKNGEKYLSKLQSLETKLQSTIASLPKEKRILVTAHDAFSYFGKAYDFDVVGLQGLSTATEAGVQDVQKLANFIIDNKVKAIFVESSVPKRTIEALQAAVTSKNHEVVIGGTLYSDALGNVGTVEGTYIGMFEYNVNTIVNALK